MPGRKVIRYSAVDLCHSVQEGTKYRWVLMSTLLLTVVESALNYIPSDNYGDMLAVDTYQSAKLEANNGSGIRFLQPYNESSTEHGIITEMKGIKSTDITEITQKPGLTHFHWYLYDDQADHKSHSLKENDYYYGTVLPPPEYDKIPLSHQLSQTYGSQLVSNPNTAFSSSSFMKGQSKGITIVSKLLLFKKIVLLLFPILFPLHLFLFFLPLTLPAIPLAFLAGRQSPPASPNCIQFPISIVPHALTSTTTILPTTSGIVISPTSTSVTTTTTRPPFVSITRPPPNETEPVSQPSNQTTTPSTTTQQSTIPPSPPPITNLPSTPENNLPTPPPFFPPAFPPFPFLFLNNTFDNLHYRLKSKLI